VDEDHETIISVSWEWLDIDAQATAERNGFNVIIALDETSGQHENAKAETLRR
jgi:hypothetical protein